LFLEAKEAHDAERERTVLKLNKKEDCGTSVLHPKENKKKLRKNKGRVNVRG